tara:strand:- start:269 stop:457 length:189 start_codon:yes stop_codon:yes gene_type:complete
MKKSSNPNAAEIARLEKKYAPKGPVPRPMSQLMKDAKAYKDADGGRKSGPRPTNRRTVKKPK